MLPDTLEDADNQAQEGKRAHDELEELRDAYRRAASQLVSINDSAAILKITRRSVYRRIEAGVLDTVEVWPGRVYVTRQSLATHLKQISDDVNAALAELDALGEGD